MPDRVEREIEEILAKLDEELPAGTAPPERAPISLAARRRQPRATSRAANGLSTLADGVSPATLLLAGAGVMVAGLLFANVWAPLIWLSFAGVVLFLGAFAASFFRSPRAPGAAAQPQGHYWRDRYIEYTPQDKGPIDRLKRRFRRR